MKKSNKNSKNNFRAQLNELKQELYRLEDERVDYIGIVLFARNQLGSILGKEVGIIAKMVEEKADVLLAKIDPTNEIYMNVVLIKVFGVMHVVIQVDERFRTTTLSDEELFKEAEPKLIEYRKLLEPYKHRVEGIWLSMLLEMTYIQLTDRVAKKMLLEQNNNASYNHAEALTKFEAAKAYYDKLSRSKKIWKINEIFRCNSDRTNQQNMSIFTDGTNVVFEMLVHLTLTSLACKSFDTGKIIQYSIPALQIMAGREIDQTLLPRFVTVSFMVFGAFLKGHFFAQAQHIAAVAMHKIVEFRRILPTEKRTTLNPIQYEASYMYAALGSVLVEMSFKWKNGEEVTDNLHQDQCVRLISESKVLEQYEKQFPKKLTMDVEAIKRMKNKTKLWIDRMKELKKTNTAPSPKWLHNEQELKDFEKLVEEIQL